MWMYHNANVFPAHAGMSRSVRVNESCSSRFPRPRGDEPFTHEQFAEQMRFSPPTRG